MYCVRCSKKNPNFAIKCIYCGGELRFYDPKDYEPMFRNGKFIGNNMKADYVSDPIYKMEREKERV